MITVTVKPMRFFYCLILDILAYKLYGWGAVVLVSLACCHLED